VSLETVPPGTEFLDTETGGQKSTRAAVIVGGRLPRGIGVERLRDPPTEWRRQFEALGLNPE